MATLILSVIGSDRPGLTQALADAVLSAGGNWLESHLSRLAASMWVRCGWSWRRSTSRRCGRR